MAVFLKRHWECNSEEADGKQAIVPMIEEAVVRHDVLPMNLLVVDDEQYVRQLMRRCRGAERHESHQRVDR